MNDLLTLTVSQLRCAADLKEQIEALNSELSAILGGDDLTPSAPSTSGPKVKRNGKLTVGSAILEALKANGGIMDKSALLKAATGLKGSKINEGSFNGEVQKLKGNGGIKSPGRGHFQIGSVAASAPTSAPAVEPKAKRTMSAAGRAKIAAAAKARWAKVRASKERGDAINKANRRK
jgi:hypothetical protein